VRRIQNHKIDDCRCPLSGRLSDQLAFVRSTIIAPNGLFMLGNCTQSVLYLSVRRPEPTLAATRHGDPALPGRGAMT
jgi:hypothetical protein